jgi:hypothetical protein
VQAIEHARSLLPRLIPWLDFDNDSARRGMASSADRHGWLAGVAESGRWRARWGRSAWAHGARSYRRSGALRWAER